MPAWHDVVAIARTLPETEVGTWYGTPGLKVGGKGFARFRAESDGGLVLLCTPAEKAAHLASGDPAFYTTPHYDGYGSILVNLSLIDAARLGDLVRRAWRMKASRRLQQLVGNPPDARPEPGARRRPRVSGGAARGRRGRR